MILTTRYLVAAICFISQTQYSYAGNIASCPTTPITTLTSSGAQFQTCPNSDFQVPSINIIGGVASASACVQLCLTNNNGVCRKAVYDHVNSVCHIKGDPTNPPWVTSTQYDGIMFVRNVADGSALTSCASQSSTSTSGGVSIVICPMSDYQVPSTNIINSVADVATCGSLCSRQASCSKAVFDRVNSICHLKGNPTNAPWVVSLKQYDSVAIVRGQGTPTTTSQASTLATSTTAAPASSTVQGTKPSGLPACPSGATTFTTDDGSLYETCPNTDYAGPSTQILGQMLSSWDCLQQCNIAAKCNQAVFDPNNFLCYLKDPSSVWVTSSKFTSIRFLSKTTRPSVPSKNGSGSWGPVIRMPVIPVAAYVVPEQPVSKRVLMFSSWGPDDFSGPTGITQFADYNYVTGATSQRTIVNTQHDMFCPGISTLQDGRIVITGGENAEATSFYNPSTDSFTRGPDMKIPRGYQTSATTSSGKIFTVGGSFTGGIGGKTGELFDPVANSWTLLPGANVTPILTTDAEGAWRTDNHAWLFGWKSNSVFQAGPSKVQHWYGTTGQGSVSTAGVRDPDNDAMCGIFIMYDAVNGKIFSTGGSQSYTNSDAFTKTFITTIGDPFTPSAVERVADMINPRGFGNGVVLPDGTILVTGGQKRSLVFTDIDSILAPELFDPASKTFKQLAPAAIPRNYHSVSVLLSDGTVFTGGGGMCPTAYNQTDAWCNRASDHPSVEIFSPPYLFNADGTSATRPVINALSTSSSGSGLTAKVGGTLTVTMNDASGATFSLIRIGSATHSSNTDQRRVPLSNVVANQAVYQIQIPNDSGIVIPGYYYLFAISKAGVPSVARTVQVTT